MLHQESEESTFCSTPCCMEIRGVNFFAHNTIFFGWWLPPAWAQCIQIYSIFGPMHRKSIWTLLVELSRSCEHPKYGWMANWRCQFMQNLTLTLPYHQGNYKVAFSYSEKYVNLWNVSALFEGHISPGTEIVWPWRMTIRSHFNTWRGHIFHESTE